LPSPPWSCGSIFISASAPPGASVARDMPDSSSGPTAPIALPTAEGSAPSAPPRDFRTSGPNADVTLSRIDDMRDSGWVGGARGIGAPCGRRCRDRYASRQRQTLDSRLAALVPPALDIELVT
jgi:hypothetical protein